VSKKFLNRKPPLDEIALGTTRNAVFGQVSQLVVHAVYPMRFSSTVSTRFLNQLSNLFAREMHLMLGFSHNFKSMVPKAVTPMENRLCTALGPAH